MEFEEIMQSITQGLTGDGETDQQFLIGKMEEYKDHEYSVEIIRACGRMLYDCLSDDQRDDFEKAWGKDLKSIQVSIDELNFLMYKKDFDRATELASSLVKTADEYPMYKDDTKSSYYNFQEPFEEMLFSQYTQDGKDIRRADFPFPTIYFLYGNLMVETKQYDEAKASLRKALKWDPASCMIAFEYAETLKLMGDLDEYAEITRNCYKYAFKPADIARYYRNLGYYFVEKEQYEAAAACYQISAAYCDSKEAQSELYYIQTKAGTLIKQFTPDEIEEIAYAADFPCKPCEDVINCALGYGMAFLKNNNIDGAVYCFSIFTDITHDKDIAQVVEQLKSSQEESQE